MQTKIADKPICCFPPNNNKPNPFINFFKMPIKVNFLEQTAETQISRQKSTINLCCIPLNNNKPNPFINLFKMPIKLNSLEKTAETQISRQKTPINQNAVLYQ